MLGALFVAGHASDAARHRRHRPPLVGARPSSASGAERRREAPAADAPASRGVSRWTNAPPARCFISTALTSRSTAFKAINNLSLTIEPGEMRAIIGPNGAGKTTMMDIITGKTRPDEGDVYFDGAHRPDAARRDRHRRARHRPQVPEADGVREPHRRGQSRLALKVDQRGARRCSGASAPKSASASTACSRPSA